MQNSFHLVEQNNIFERWSKVVVNAEPEALKVDDKRKEFSSFDVFEELVTHSNVDMSSLHETRQVSNRYL